MAMIALKMGPPEMASLIFLSLLIITAVAGDSMVKGLIVGAIGLTVGLIGLDSITAVRRFGFWFCRAGRGHFADTHANRLVRGFGIFN